MASLVSNDSMAFSKPETLEMVPIPCEDLPVGEALDFPLYDLRGVLLLAAGTQITPRFLENLRVQHTQTIHITQNDVSRLEGIYENDFSGLCGELLNAHTETTRLLDLMLDDEANLLFDGDPRASVFVVNRCLGAKPYNIDMARDLFHHQGRSMRQVANVLDDILNFHPNAETQYRIVRSYLNFMKNDLDLVVASACMGNNHLPIPRHCLMMCLLGMSVAVELGFETQRIFVVGLTGLLHDVGMLKVPKRAYSHGKRLNVSQYLDVMKHVIHSANLLEGMPGVPNATRLASYQVHERCNGTGYPRRRSRNQIHPIARILGVVDAYLSYVSPCTHHRAMLPYSAMVALLNQSARGLFDPEVTRALLNVLSLYPIGSNVILNDGRAGRVIRSNGAHYDRPVIQIFRGVDGDIVDDVEIVDLMGGNDKLKVVQAVRHLSQ